MTNLHSKEEPKKIQSPEQIADYLRVTYVPTYLLATAATVLLAAFIIWGFLGTVSDKAYFSGVVFPMQGTADVTLPNKGIVRNMLVHNGDSVRQGQTVAMISIGDSHSFLTSGVSGLVISTKADNEPFEAFEPIVSVVDDNAVYQQWEQQTQLIAYADNEAHVSFRVDKWGRFSEFTTKPHLSNVQVINKMRFNASRENVDFVLEYGSPSLVLTGLVCPGSYNLTFANPSPGQLLADSMLQSLKRQGTKVLERTGLFHNVRPPEDLLVTHCSPVLTDIVRSLLDRSDNMFTHALLRAVAVRDKNWKGDELDHIGVECVQHLLQARGIDSDALFMRDGSGLARAGKASPHMFVQMLAYMASRKYGTDQLRLCDLMPKAGSRIGSLLHPASEPQYAFAVLVNNYNCSRKELKNLIDRLLINIFGSKK